jgi:hypothetical protein
MRYSNLTKVMIVAVGLLSSSLASAFVGQMVVGFGEMDPEIGRIQSAFSADLTFESEDMTGKSQIYYQSGKVRDEVNMGEMQTVTIRNFNTNKFYMLMPAMSGMGPMYREIDGSNNPDEAPDYKLISREKMGAETVNGIPATKYKSVYESKDGKFGGFTWFTDDNIAVKAFMIHESKGDKQRFKFELSNLQRGSQDESLFELPPGATKMGAMGMMGMGGGGVDMAEMQRQAAEAQRQQDAASASTASQSSTSKDSDDDGSFAGEVADEAQDSAQDAVKDETGNAVEEGIRKGFGKLFGR